RGVTADRPISDEMHEDEKDRYGDHDPGQPLAPAGRHHGEPIAPGQPRFVMGKPDGATRRGDHAASACSATSARKVSSRLALSLAPVPLSPFLPTLSRN